MKLCVVLVAVFLASCDTSGENLPFDPTGSQNALGQLCQTPANCPPAHSCVILQSGNGQGYCSPVCNVDTDCADGYTGPQTGGLTCFSPVNSQACTITCSGPQDCPAGLGCKGAAGAPIRFCAPGL